MDNIVHVVHCIDTEGPLYESLADTFYRLTATFGIRMEASEINLRKIQKGEISGVNQDVARSIQRAFSPALLNYNDTWDKIDLMLDEILSPSYRDK